MTEGAANRVLPAEADRRALEQQGTVGKHLARRPVDTFAARDALVTLVEQRGQAAMRMEALRRVVEGVGDEPELLGRHAGARARVVARPREALPDSAEREDPLPRLPLSGAGQRAVE